MAKTDSLSADTLADVLRAGREASGLSVRQLEAQSDVPKSVISRLENGESRGISPKALVRLAKALELRASDLFLLAGIPIPSDLPSLPAMLRAEYNLPPEAIASIQKDVERLAKKHRPADKQENTT